MQPYEPPTPHWYLKERKVSCISHTGCDLRVFSGHHPEPCLRNFSAVPLAQPAVCVMNCAERKLMSDTRIAHRPVPNGMLINRHLICERQVCFFLAMADIADLFPV